MTEVDLRRSLQEFAVKKGLKALVLFGSHARGIVKRDSDVDVAIYTDKRADLFKMTNELIRATHENNIDLVDLRRCNPVLGMQVLKYGEVLHRTPDAMGEIGSYICRRYADTKKFRDQADKFIRNFVAGEKKP